MVFVAIVVALMPKETLVKTFIRIVVGVCRKFYFARDFIRELGNYCIVDIEGKMPEINLVFIVCCGIFILMYELLWYFRSPFA